MVLERECRLQMVEAFYLEEERKEEKNLRYKGSDKLHFSVMLITVSMFIFLISTRSYGYKKNLKENFSKQSTKIYQANQKGCQ